MNEPYKSKEYTAIYGNIRIKKGFCNNCMEEAFIIDGNIQCCGEKYANVSDFLKKKYMIQSNIKRKGLSAAEKRAIIRTQENKCFYCGHEFGTFYQRKRGKKFVVAKLTIHMDHVIPFVMNGNATPFVAACNVCNGLKSGLVFNNIESIKKYLANKIRAKRIEFFKMETHGLTGEAANA
jgi:hypothetical protein